jgi:hypothetical protein
MKKFCILPVIVALAFFVSCQKQQTEEERRAEIDREVQQKLDAERQAQEKNQLAQRQADLEAREKALAEKEAAAQRKPETESPSPTERIAREAPESRGAKSYDMFYTRLERYGDWRETSDYGYVWQPRDAARRGWRPYTNGHWVYSDAGWTWISEEPFGWATYHYGRWVRLRNIGWVWVPGEEWAPAWVSWRTGNEFVGWAPLPPEARFDRRSGIHKWADNYYDIGPDQYCFVSQREFGSPRVDRAVVPVERNVTIVNQTTNVTNITYNNTTIVNQGPSYDELRVRSQEPIQRYRLERRTEVNEEASHPVVRGDVLEVSAPIITAEITQRPRTTKAPITQVTVERGWAPGSNQAAAQEARAKMKAEATVPPDAPPKTFVKPAAATTMPTATAAPSATASPMKRSTHFSPAATPMLAASQTPTLRPRLTATPTVSATITPGIRAEKHPTPNPAALPSSTAAITEPQPTATPPAKSLETPERVPSITSPHRPSASATATPTASAGVPQAQREEKSGERKQLRGVESRRQKFEPRRTVPMTSSASPTPAPTSTSSPSSPSISLPSASPGEKLTKEEKKKQKRQRREAAQTGETISPSPSATPE